MKLKQQTLAIAPWHGNQNHRMTLNHPQPLLAERPLQSYTRNGQLTIGGTKNAQTEVMISSFSPPARCGLLDFMSDARLLLLVVHSFLPSFLPPSFLAGPHLPALDRSGPRRTSSASS